MLQVPVCDVHKCCRLCLSEGEDFIFENEPCKEIPVAAKIMVCISLPVLPTDGLSKFICLKCAKMVQDFFTFREACWNAHLRFIQFRKTTEKQLETVSDPTPAVNVNDEELSRDPPEQKTVDGTIESSFVEGDKFLDKEDRNLCCDKSVKEQETFYDFEVVEDHDYNFSFDHKNPILETVSFAEDKHGGNNKDKERGAEDIKQIPEQLCENIKMPSIAVSGVGHLKCYRCSDCVKVFPSIKALNKHKNVCSDSMKVASDTLSQEENSENIGSEVDSETGKLDAEMVEGRTRWEGKRSYPCPTCGKVFKVPAVLRNHIKIHTGERPFLCSLCSRSFRQLGALRNHEMKHSGTSTHPCKICGKGFFRPSDLEKHVRSHTGERPYMCSVCSKTFHQLSGLLVHERIHTGERPYACAICPATFNQWANKQRHEKTHAGGAKPFTCAVCHRKYSDRKEMELHQAAHGGGRPRVCPFCEKAFRKPSELRDHLRRLHTNERPYECDICSKKFCAVREMKQHLLVHSGERPFKCTLCPRAYSQKGNLRRHQQRHHESRDSLPSGDNNE